MTRMRTALAMSALLLGGLAAIPVQADTTKGWRIDCPPKDMQQLVATEPGNFPAFQFRADATSKQLYITPQAAAIDTEKVGNIDSSAMIQPDKIVKVIDTSQVPVMTTARVELTQKTEPLVNKVVSDVSPGLSGAIITTSTQSPDQGTTIGDPKAGILKTGDARAAPLDSVATVGTLGTPLGHQGVTASTGRWVG